jgi:hypothetical protein
MLVPLVLSGVHCERSAFSMQGGLTFQMDSTGRLTGAFKTTKGTRINVSGQATGHLR